MALKLHVMATHSTTLIVSIDGMRPDGLAAADTPTIDGLIARGASTMQATTVMPSVTLPCHTSMFRGVDVPRHGITTNVFQPLARPVPSLFDAARAAGKRVGAFTNWEELRDLGSPGSVDVAYCFNRWDTPEDDMRPAQALAQHFEVGERFDLVFLYLGFTDASGHTHGWMSPEYLKAIEGADRCVSVAISAIERTGVELATIALSDHGGHERTHGTDRPEDMLIPWIACGRGIRHGVRIESPVRIFDTCPTAAALLGIDLAREWDGRVVAEALEPE